MSDFVHLHVHSHYSLLDSTVKLDELLKKTEALNMSAVALTDHLRMCGALELQNRASKTRVKPIHGLAIQVEPLATTPRDPKPDHQLILLAENLEGYKNLVHIVSQAWHDDAARYYGTEKALPRASWETIRNHHQGVICLSGDLGGEIPTWILRKETEAAEETARELQKIFGEHNFYLELQRTPELPEQEEVCEALIDMGRRLHIPLVATGNVHYLNREDYIAHGILTCVGLEKRVTTEMLEMLPVKDLYLKSPEEMKQAFVDVPEAIANTVRIAERCNVTIPTGTYYLPAFSVPEGQTENEYLKHLALQGLHERFEELQAAHFPYQEQEYLDRLDMEFGVISEMGYAGYFLIVGDFIRWARENRIPVGPGRGSGAG